VKQQKGDYQMRDCQLLLLLLLWGSLCLRVMEQQKK
jgi:hypothetical protein